MPKGRSSKTLRVPRYGDGTRVNQGVRTPFDRAFSGVLDRRVRGILGEIAYRRMVRK